MMSPKTEIPVIKNYVNGEWIASKSTGTLDMLNPATTEVPARVSMSTKEEVLEAIQYAKEAYEERKETPIANPRTLHVALVN